MSSAFVTPASVEHALAPDEQNEVPNGTADDPSVPRPSPPWRGVS
ncbi:MAG TPA: hypothetical protein VMI54_12895 [Polyangiaceae bacterium]|nr:hypothetical protein [Polyangiaceae bacterium]